MAVSKSVTVIPARKHVRKSEDEEKPKLRVAAYCRVSTDSDEQATSYDTQIEHYTTYIQGHPDWAVLIIAGLSYFAFILSIAAITYSNVLIFVLIIIHYSFSHLI